MIMILIDKKKYADDMHTLLKPRDWPAISPGFWPCYHTKPKC